MTDTPGTDIAVVDNTAKLQELEIAEREIALQAARFAAREQQALLLANSQIVPKAYRITQQNPNAHHDILAAGIYGDRFGWDLTTSLSYIDMIDGKAEISAKGKVGLVRRDGHSIMAGDCTAQSATAIGKRSDGDQMTVTYTMEDAKTAGLAHKANYKKHPKSMLWARAVSVLCVRLFPDVELGAYVEDELTPEAHGLRSTPEQVQVDVGDDYPDLDEPDYYLADVIEVFEAIAEAGDQALCDKINERAASRYKKNPKIGKDIYSIPDNELPSTEIEALYEYVRGQAEEAGHWPPPADVDKPVASVNTADDAGDDAATVVEGELVTEPTNQVDVAFGAEPTFMPDAVELDDNGTVVQEADTLGAREHEAPEDAELVENGEPF